jgi:hypothetical protein
MNLKITQNQYNILKSKLQQLDLFDDTIEDVCGQEIDYKNFGFDSWGNMVYINLPDNTADEREELYSRIKISNCDIVLHNIITNEKFTVSPDDIRLTKSEYKKLWIPPSVYEQKIFPYLPKIDQFSTFISSTPIKTALKRAFSSNWVEENDTHIAGVVGVLEIKFNNPLKWSIVNFFNSKTTVINLLKVFLSRDYLKETASLNKNDISKPKIYYFYEKNGEIKKNSQDIEESVILWMENLFKDIYSQDMEELVKIQSKSIINGFNDELKNAKSIQKILHIGKKIHTPGYGTILDYKEGVDAIIGGVTYQIKPFSKITFKGDSISVNIGRSNANTYKPEFVDRIAFFNGDEFYVFKNNGKQPIGKTYEFSDKKDEESDLLYPLI